MTPLNALIEVQKEFRPSDGWICTSISPEGGVRIWHPELGARMCWVNGHRQRVRVETVESKYPEALDY